MFFDYLESSERCQIDNNKSCDYNIHNYYLLITCGHGTAIDNIFINVLVDMAFIDMDITHISIIVSYYYIHIIIPKCYNNIDVNTEKLNDVFIAIQGSRYP